MVIHVVMQGETIESIANSYGVSPLDLIAYNALSEPERLVVGQTIVFLFPEQTHTVSSGETLTSIAQRYQITVNALYRNNPTLHALPNLRPGQSLVISYTQPKLGALQVTGYAYPFIDLTLLREVLPYLTYLIPFTYGFRPDGNLVDLDDGALLSLAQEYQIPSLMHLSTLTESGNFSNELASLALNDMAVQNQLIQSVLDTMIRKGYSGLDIDFEFVLPEDRIAYAQFINRLRDTLNPLGFPVIAALAPKTSSDQKGLLYEGHDYALIGEAANAVLLMTYEWGYTYGPPLAVAPINQVTRVVDYALTEIPSDQMYLGIPNYGYNWTLPFIRGDSRAQSISNVTAVDTARRYGAEILFDPIAQAPHFSYTDESGLEHEVWFEDARSIRAKLELASNNRFLGVGYWNLVRPFPQNYLVLNALYNILPA